ncbi:MAG: hypothetical protein KAX84_12935, partial [Burkholderiales bacterium]|nr:hypothetical protein [Burkholderiales bacterium]
AGWGAIDGRIVYVSAEDVTVQAGTRGHIAGIKVTRIRELALQHKRPYIALMEAGAGRFQENNGAFSAGIGERFEQHFNMSGRVPQVAAIMGACFGGPSFGAAQSDFVPIVRGTGFLGMSGPPVVKVGIGEIVSAEELAGAEKVSTISGQVDLVASDDADCLRAIRKWLSYFPSNCDELPPSAPGRAALADTEAGSRRISEMVSENHRRGYDMEELLKLLVDEDSMFAYRPAFGPNLITTWARFQGKTVGVLANNPMKNAGVLDFKGATKARKFIELCDAYHVPLVFLTDCPGFLVGTEVEKTAMVTLAARWLNALLAAKVPKVTIVLRKAVGLAYLAMGGRAMHPDAIFAWPTARFDVLGTAAGVELAHGKEIRKAADPEHRRAELMKIAEAQSHAFLAAEMALIDDVISPAETRGAIIAALGRAEDSRRPGFKHRIDP